MKKNHKLILAFIIFIGFLIRIFNLSSLPLILNRDEAALAYNGLLISQSAKDEFAKSWPLTLESFGDYKLPGYPYTLAILFKILPINDFTVRLPSVLAGTLLIFISYFLARNFKFSIKQSLFFSFLIALGPIFIFYSRIAFEANVALTLFVISITLLTLPKSNLKTDLWAGVITFIAILFYNTPLLLLPFIILALIISRGIKKPQNWLPVASLLTFIFIIMFMGLAGISSQKSGITIFSDETIWTESVTHYNSYTGISQKILGNKIVFYITKIWPRFFESFSMHFLVTGGGTHPWHNLPTHAHLYYTTYFLGLVGLLLLIFKSMRDKKHLFILLILISSLAPSVITVDSPHATRSLLFIYLLTFTGLYSLTIIRKKYFKKILSLLVLLVILESSRYMYLYFGKYPATQPSSLKIGYPELINEVNKNHSDKNIAVIDEAGFQYILTAWYLKIPSDEFFSTIIKQLPDRIGFKYGQQLSNYHFIAHPDDRDEAETVLVEWIDNRWQVRQF
ncbi:MAG: glycosyltransferase family 39 protein [Candidatus Pacebacteria bacterium]|nr:glycosyltransferase family 39 protein [Candidatus Paceibacterota bacterium]